MRDKSIQCDWNCTRLVQEAACEDAVATYVDVARFLFGEGGCTKQLARSKPHDGAGFYVQKGLSDEMEEDEDLHNKLKSSDQANISDEQEFNAENTHFRENARVTQVT